MLLLRRGRLLLGRGGDRSSSFGLEGWLGLRVWWSLVLMGCWDGGEDGVGDLRG